MLGERALQPVGVGVQHGHAHPQLPVAELVVEPAQDLVAGAADYLGVEAPVGGHHRGEVAPGGVPALFVEEGGEPVEQPGWRGHGSAYGELLDQQPGFEHVVDLLCGDRQDQRALLRVQLQQPLGLQPQQRLADRGAGHPDGFGEFALGQEGAAFVAAVEHTLLDVPVDAVGGGRGRGGGGGGAGGGRVGGGGAHGHRIDTTEVQAVPGPGCGRRPAPRTPSKDVPLVRPPAGRTGPHAPGR